MLSLFSALVLGVVEGFTEFLPISSTAHLNLAADLLRLAQTDYMKTFEIAIQSGAILAVLVLYGKRFLRRDVLTRVAVAFLPTGILGLVLYKLVKTYLIGNTLVVLWALAAGGVLLILFEKFHSEKDAVASIGEISYAHSFVIGVFQSVAMIPGVSRAAATIVGGMLLGLRRELIAEFSFLLAVPTMFAATGLDLAQNIHAFSAGEMDLLLVGFVASFVTAVAGIKFLLAYIRAHSFTGFGVYRIVLVAAFLAMMVFA
ncbi:MAG: undecaprenyl-diphosphatase [Candidatus Liptonbacteria bacterium RIFCSPLOWO2_01_FULL_56_20]|uniref:Undecaprenyl-diphosphatase n=1 Tax=Candidatus Liptonbacteria bacterium RIFCSPLOWO2_01_FULL_56_20 TaxID=1798652 RepID=A0A1G2CKF3_9BACT|nr:MAG: Undecaprenyl-diphosphatase [Parcubacteria group bacterium GW2011_GWB1_56_8]OGY98034.1 MAG: undecaprenyl-diphosphatase [Candidatus Liptonbacteria bacterium RIFCSPHIGHO2_01_FULL_56_18b]OGZ01692.1 MAG: undecaprenyl-diphosphatase [Candidatus Liptonbacteria bacterium RIFCSPLOWO2_01_FULL_56_20]